MWWPCSDWAVSVILASSTPPGWAFTRSPSRGKDKDPLAEFLEETMRVLGTDAEEVLVERAKPLRNNAGPDEAAFVSRFNDMMASPK
jgi:hypothetical protein